MLRARTILVEQGQCQWAARGKKRENVLRVDELEKQSKAKSQAPGCALDVRVAPNAGCASGKERELIGEELGVLCCELFLVPGQIINRMDRVRCTGRNTGSAIDAAIGLHIELGGGFKLRFIRLRMNAVCWAHVHTKQVFNAGVHNHVGHDEVFLNMNWSLELLRAERIEVGG